MADGERRHALERRVAPSIVASRMLRRVSWQGIAAGTLIALSVQRVFFVLGAALSARLRPDLWIFLCTLLALIPGGWVGARTAGIPTRADSAFQGLFVWAAVVLVNVPWGPPAWIAAALDADARSSGGPSLFLFLALVGGAAAASVAGWYAAPYDVTTHSTSPLR